MADNTEIHIDRLAAENAALRERVEKYRRALELAAVRLEILTARARGCHEQTGMHELMDEAEMFCREARAALATPTPEPTTPGQSVLQRTMNIYAKKGEKVVYSRPKNGYDHDQEVARQHLIAGDIYTVERTKVGQSSTTVWLQEVPQCGFNSVLFENAESHPATQPQEPQQKQLSPPPTHLVARRVVECMTEGGMYGSWWRELIESSDSVLDPKGSAPSLQAVLWWTFQAVASWAQQAERQRVLGVLDEMDAEILHTQRCARDRAYLAASPYVGEREALKRLRQRLSQPQRGGNAK